MDQKTSSRSLRSIQFNILLFDKYTCLEPRYPLPPSVYTYFSQRDDRPRKSPPGLKISSSKLFITWCWPLINTSTSLRLPVHRSLLLILIHSQSGLCHRRMLRIVLSTVAAISHVLSTLNQTCTACFGITHPTSSHTPSLPIKVHVTATTTQQGGKHDGRLTILFPPPTLLQR